MEPSSLTDAPKHHPDCCLAISRPLLKTLVSTLPRAPRLVLSIGSGSGLLEATLLRFAPDQVDIIGVEVSQTVNKHLPESNTFFVNGTWALHAEAQTAAAWMFVYPREPKLVQLYLETRSSDDLRTIVWLGPRSDWEDYASVFELGDAFKITLIEDCGAAAYELMAVMSRT